jgi:hypothetical protein
MLHSVATLSKIFEKKFNQTFPFPPILFVVQNFEHELRENTPEMYLKWVLEEKENSLETEEIQKYNETVRVVKQFPDLTETKKILLIGHPHRMTYQSKLPHLNYDDLDFEYKSKIQEIKLIIKNQLKPKNFNFMSVNGEFLADLSRELVHSMNTLDGYDVGPALVRELSLELMRNAFELYVKKMNSISLPENLDILKNLHLHSKNDSMQLFEQNCTGGIESFDNSKSYSKLISSMDDFYQNYQSNNTLQSELYCTSILSEKFKSIRAHHYGSVEDYDWAIIELKSEYVAEAKGPDEIKVKAFDNFLSKESSLKRELVMRENSQKDFKQLILLLVVSFFTVFFSSFFIPWNILKSLSTAFVIVIIAVIVIFHNIFETATIVSFEEIQYMFNFFKGIGGSLYSIKSFLMPILWKSYSIIQPIVDPYKKQLFLFGVLIGLYLYLKNKFKSKDPVLPKMNQDDEEILKKAMEILNKTKNKKDKILKIKIANELSKEKEELILEEHVNEQFNTSLENLFFNEIQTPKKDNIPLTPTLDHDLDLSEKIQIPPNGTPKSQKSRTSQTPETPKAPIKQKKKK